VRTRVIFLPFSILLMIRQESCSGVGLIRFFNSSSVSGTKGWLDLNSRCCVVGVNRSQSWKDALVPLQSGLDTV